MLTRRRFLQASAAAGAGLMLQRTPAAAAPALLPLYTDPMPIPPFVSPPVVDRTAIQALEVREFATRIHSLLPGPTRVWGYGEPETFGAGRSTFLGPTLVVDQDVPLEVTFQNRLPAEPLFPPSAFPMPMGYTGHHFDPTREDPVRINTHLHGGDLPDADDGNPYFTPVAGEIRPGDEQPLRYPNAQPGTLLFYHDHAIGITRTNVYAGLAGGYVIRDQNEKELIARGILPAPPYELPMVIQDRSFLADGQLLYPPTWAPEFFGDTVLVNGVAWPFRNVEPRRYRLRIVNGSTSRFYNLAFGRNLPVWQIGTDGGLMRTPKRIGVDVPSVILAPAERADLIVDFTGAAGRNVVVTDLPLPRGAVSPTRPIGDFMRFEVSRQATSADVGAASWPVADLGGREITPVTGAPGAFRTLTLEEVMGPKGPAAALINGKYFHDTAMMETPPETVAKDATEVWAFVNLTADTHPLHVHLVQFEILGRQAVDTRAYTAALTAAAGAAPRDPAAAIPDVTPYLAPGAFAQPDANELGYKDTARMNPGEVTFIRATFPRAGKYAYHCHILEHEDNDMMQPFLVR